MNKYLLCTLCIVVTHFVLAQRYDSLVFIDSARSQTMQAYRLNDEVFVYPRPKPAAFVTQIPRTFPAVAKIAFRKESIKGWAVIAGTTAALLILDEDIADGVQQFSRYIGLSNDRIYKDLVKFKLGKTQFDVYQAPGNVNTAIYSIGEGIPPLLISAGLWGYGLAHRDNRAISTASQIVQATTAAGFMTQFLKRTTGRQSPFAKTQPGGKWSPFPNPKTYQSHVPNFDAFPSGHMGTLVSTYVVITQNYPEKKWIKPVGISIMSLVGLSMINNGVHWASDYPMAVGIGYAFGMATVKLNRFVQGEPLSNKKWLLKKKKADHH